MKSCAASNPSPGAIKSRWNSFMSRKLRNALLAGLLPACLAACHKHKSPVSEPEPTPAPSASPTPTPVAAATPVPTPNHFAPPGVYFLVVPVSVVTDEGITGLRPGTRVTQRADGRFQAESQVIDLQSNQITNDLWVAAQAAGSDQAAQAMIRKMSQPPASGSSAASSSPISAGLLPAQPQPKSPQATPAPTSNPLAAPAKKVNPQYFNGVPTHKIH